MFNALSFDKLLILKAVEPVKGKLFDAEKKPKDGIDSDNL